MTPHRMIQCIPYLLGIALLAAASGCNEELNVPNTGSQSRFERTVVLRIALDGSDTLDVLSKFGVIAVAGADVTDCNLVAKIVAQAPTEGEAQELAEQVEIVGQPSGSTLKVRSKDPDQRNNRWVGVNYTITIPRRMNLRCDSGYGWLDVSQIEGRLDGRSGNGSIRARDIRGPTDLSTSYGTIECENVTGSSITLKSGNGGITAKALRGSVTAESAYGSITCEDFADGDLKLKSGNGRIAITNASFGVCEARSSYGAVAGKDLKGDSVTLGSGNGSVEADNVQVKTLGLSSDYGVIRAARITTSNLSAASGNGGIHIDCSRSAPADLNARAKSSYGSIEFDAPAGFSGQVDLSTSYGVVRTTLPVTIKGEITGSKLTGKVGDGDGKIHLESGGGSVELK
jgi:DUF4097 and DUF4098 domain-containing protein YvlB